MLRGIFYLVGSTLQVLAWTHNTHTLQIRTDERGYAERHAELLFLLSLSMSCRSFQARTFNKNESDLLQRWAAKMFESKTVHLSEACTQLFGP